MTQGYDHVDLFSTTKLKPKDSTVLNLHVTYKNSVKCGTEEMSEFLNCLPLRSEELGWHTLTHIKFQASVAFM